jgi:phosphoglycolate phosphatase
MTQSFPSCLLFDLDGTIVDSLPGIEFSIREAFTFCQLPLAEQHLRELIGPPIRTILSRAGNVVEEARLEALEKAFRTSYDTEGWRKTVSFPEADRVLQELRARGYRLFVVSNKPRHASLRTLEKEHVLDCFERIITRDSRSPSYQTKEEMIDALLIDGTFSSQDCIMVGDTVEDATAAARARIPFILMRHGYGDLSRISSVPIARTLDNFLQLLELLTKELALD